MSAARCCCNGPTQCYCGTLCEAICDQTIAEGTPTTWCITTSLWDRYVPTLSGTGTGAVISIGGYLYYFDGTTSEDCHDIPSSEDIYWHLSFRADECPTECPAFSVTWSGAASFEIQCCTGSDYTTDGSLTLTNKTVSFSAGCSGGSGTTTSEPFVAGNSCDGLLDVTTQNGRIRIEVTPNVPDDVWECVVTLLGTVGGDTDCFFGLRWTAPLSPCPPTEGWTYDAAGSNEADVTSPSCPDAGPYCTNFSPGSITLTYA